MTTKNQTKKKKKQRGISFIEAEIQTNHFLMKSDFHKNSATSTLNLWKSARQSFECFIADD